MALVCCASLAGGAAQQVAKLTTIHRVFVESMGEDPISKQAQAMLVSALVASQRFVVTEERSHADAVLKGAAIEKTSHEVHAYGEGTAVGSAGAAAVANSDGAAAAANSRHAATSDSSLNTETDEDATVAVRLVDAQGDVIWSTTQESKGGKYKGASATAVEECVKQLLHDAAKAAAIDGH